MYIQYNTILLYYLFYMFFYCYVIVLYSFYCYVLKIHQKNYFGIDLIISYSNKSKQASKQRTKAFFCVLAFLSVY